MASSLQPGPQLNSSFLTLLPLEIRLQIYEEVLTSLTLPVCLTNTGESVTLPSDLLAIKLLSLPLTCRQIYNETILMLYSTNTFILKTSTALRKLTAILPSSHLTSIHHLHFTYPLPHVPQFTNLSLSQDSAKCPLQPQDITWIENWTALSGMTGLKKLHVELDVPIFWRNNWRDKEEEMLSWIEGCGLVTEEVVLSVLWDVRDEAVERRERFGMSNGERAKGKWRVERLERAGEEGNLWEREWGYLVDLGLSG